MRDFQNFQLPNSMFEVAQTFNYAQPKEIGWGEKRVSDVTNQNLWNP
jgi:hypothetical protein